MGLTLSGWLCGVMDDRTPVRTPPSSFSAWAVAPSSRLSVMLQSPMAGPGDNRSRWSSSHRSPHLLLSPCRRYVTRSPVEQSSDGVRAERGVSSGLHLWELLWNPAHRGSHAVVGVSGRDCLLQASGYQALVGGDSQSWGWELGTNQLWHGGKPLGVYPGERQGSPTPHAAALVGAQPALALPIPERVVLMVDADEGTLGFVVDDCFLGMAISGLPRGAKLFPAVSSVRGGATVRLRYLSGAQRDPPALMSLCKLTIQQSLGNNRHRLTERLPLPPVLRHYLQYSTSQSLACTQ